MKFQSANMQSWISISADPLQSLIRFMLIDLVSHRLLYVLAEIEILGVFSHNANPWDCKADECVKNPRFLSNVQFCTTCAVLNKICAVWTKKLCNSKILYNSNEEKIEKYFMKKFIQKKHYKVVSISHIYNLT